MILILTMCHKSIHRDNQLCKGFILSHIGQVSCVVHHGLMGLRLCISTIGISTTFCNEPKNYPPKRCMSATTIILMLCSKSMHRWNPLCKGFILSHFGWVCCVGQHCVLIHTIVRLPLVKYCKRPPKGTPRWERVKCQVWKNTVLFVCSSFFSCSSFLSHGNIVGVTIWGKIWGLNLPRGDEI